MYFLAGTSKELSLFNQTDEYLTGWPGQGSAFIPPNSAAGRALATSHAGTPLGAAAADGVFAMPILDQGFLYISVQTGLDVGFVNFSIPVLLVSSATDAAGDVIATAWPSDGKGNPTAQHFIIVSISSTTGAVKVLNSNLTNCAGIENVNAAATPVDAPKAGNGYFVYFQMTMDNKEELGFQQLWGNTPAASGITAVGELVDFDFFPRPLGNGQYSSDTMLYLGGSKTDNLMLLNIMDGTHKEALSVKGEWDFATQAGFQYDYQTMTATVLANGKGTFSYWLVTFDLSAPDPSGWSYKGVQVTGDMTTRAGNAVDLAPRA